LVRNLHCGRQRNMAGVEVLNKTKFLSETGYDSTFNGLRLGGAVLLVGKDSG